MAAWPIDTGADPYTDVRPDRGPGRRRRGWRLGPPGTAESRPARPSSARVVGGRRTQPKLVARGEHPRLPGGGQRLARVGPDPEPGAFGNGACPDRVSAVRLAYSTTFAPTACPGSRPAATSLGVNPGPNARARGLLGQLGEARRIVREEVRQHRRGCPGRHGVLARIGRASRSGDGRRDRRVELSPVGADCGRTWSPRPRSSHRRSPRSRAPSCGRSGRHPRLQSLGDRDLVPARRRGAHVPVLDPVDRLGVSLGGLRQTSATSAALSGVAAGEAHCPRSGPRSSRSRPRLNLGRW